MLPCSPSPATPTVAKGEPSSGLREGSWRVGGSIGRAWEAVGWAAVMRWGHGGAGGDRSLRRCFRRSGEGELRGGGCASLAGWPPAAPDSEVEGDVLSHKESRCGTAGASWRRWAWRSLVKITAVVEKSLQFIVIILKVIPCGVLATDLGSLQWAALDNCQRAASWHNFCCWTMEMTLDFSGCSVFWSCYILLYRGSYCWDNGPSQFFFSWDIQFIKWWSSCNLFFSGTTWASLCRENSSGILFANLLRKHQEINISRQNRLNYSSCVGKRADLLASILWGSMSCVALPGRAVPVLGSLPWCVQVL